ncbi:MAG TPA: SLOG family protein [Arthrobacter sp.]
MPPRLLITGSRTWVDRAVIKSALRDWWDSTGRDPQAVLVSGTCPQGADRICEEVWEHNGLTVERHPAQWKKLDGTVDKRAGFTRNAAMVDTGPDHLIAFIMDRSNGATHTLTYAKKKGIPVTVHEATSA